MSINTIPELVIRELSPDEWETYRDIRLEALKNEPRAFISTYEEALKISENDWRERLINKPKNFILFAIIGKKAIGMMGTYQKDLEDLTTIDMFGVYVSPDYRGCGVAQSLMKNIIKRVKNISGITRIRLACEYNQLAARKFYEKVGFSKYADDPARRRDLLELVI